VVVGRATYYLLVALAASIAALGVYAGYVKTLVVEGYVSDEQWYVVASINLMRFVLGVEPDTRVNSTHALYTFVVSGDPLTCAERAEELAGIQLLSYTERELRSFTAVVPVGALERLRALECVVDVFPGRLPDAAGVNRYMNWEHPLLAKLVIAASLAAAGYHELAWRLPSLVAGAATAVLAVLATARLLGPTVYGYLGLAVTAAALHLDPMMRSMSSVAMLDVYVACFTVASLLALLERRYLLASIMLGLASSAKYTGLLATPGLYLALRLEGVGSRRALLLAFLVPAAVVLATWGPGVAYLGPARWLSELLGSIRWHLSSRPPDGPPYTDPLGLCFCLSAFPLYYVDTYPYMVAACSPRLMVVAAASMAAGALLHGAIGVRRLLYPHIYLASIWAGYLAIYVAGNRTLYQFYAVQFLPVAAVSASLFPLYVAVACREPAPLLARSVLGLAREAYELARRWGAGAASALLLVSAFAAGAYSVGAWRPSSYGVAGLAEAAGDWSFFARMAGALLYAGYGFAAGRLDHATLMLALLLASGHQLAYAASLAVPLALLLRLLDAPLASWAAAGLALPGPAGALLAPGRGAAAVALAGFLASLAATATPPSPELLAGAGAAALPLLHPSLWRLRGALLPLADALAGTGFYPAWPLAARRVEVAAVAAAAALAYSAYGHPAAGLVASLALALGELVGLGRDGSKAEQPRGGQ
jgi:predicted membrane-bound dolichyl-phosphate-mannose-protein mannosyltransferase